MLQAQQEDPSIYFFWLQVSSPDHPIFLEIFLLTLAPPLYPNPQTILPNLVLLVPTPVLNPVLDLVPLLVLLPVPDWYLLWYHSGTRSGPRSVTRSGTNPGIRSGSRSRPFGSVLEVMPNMVWYQACPVEIWAWKFRQGPQGVKKVSAIGLARVYVCCEIGNQFVFSCGKVVLRRLYKDEDMPLGSRAYETDSTLSHPWEEA